MCVMSIQYVLCSIVKIKIESTLEKQRKKHHLMIFCSPQDTLDTKGTLLKDLQ